MKIERNEIITKLKNDIVCFEDPWCRSNEDPKLDKPINYKWHPKKCDLFFGMDIIRLWGDCIEYRDKKGLIMGAGGIGKTTLSKNFEKSGGRFLMEDELMLILLENDEKFKLYGDYHVKEISGNYYYKDLAEWTNFYKRDNLRKVRRVISHKEIGRLVDEMITYLEKKSVGSLDFLLCLKEASYLEHTSTQGFVECTPDILLNYLERYKEEIDWPISWLEKDIKILAGSQKVHKLYYTFPSRLRIPKEIDNYYKNNLSKAFIEIKERLDVLLEKN